MQRTLAEAISSTLNASDSEALSVDNAKPWRRNSFFSADKEVLTSIRIDTSVGPVVAVVVDWKPSVDGRWAIVLFDENELAILAEMTHLADESELPGFLWRYTAKKQDGRNDERKARFASQVGSNTLHVPAPVSAAQVGLFVSAIERLFATRTYAEALPEPEDSHTWILQANPDYYNLDAALRLLDGPLDWTLNQHANRVSEGDVVFLWRASGRAKRSAGIVARARIGKPVAPGSPHNDEHFTIGEFVPDTKPRVELVDIELIACGVAVTRAELRADSATSDLLILRAANQTVFAVTATEAKRLNERFDVVREHWRGRPMAVYASALTSAAAASVDAARDRALLSSEWWTRVDDRVSKRSAFRETELITLGSFLDGTIDLAEYRTGFDVRTCDAADAFGFGGMAGAMVLNQLDKHTDTAAASEVLREVFVVPEDMGTAQAACERLSGFFDAQRDSHGLSGDQVATGRVVTLLSFFWHLQQPEAWPAWYQTVRDRFHEWGLTGDPSAKRAAEYLEFCAAFEAVRARFDEHPWFVSRVVSDRPDAKPVLQGPTPAAPQQPNVWLYAPGRGAEHWEAFREEGIAAIGWDDMGDLSRFDSLEDLKSQMVEIFSLTKSPMNNGRTCWDFVNTMEIGDIVYAKQGLHSVIGRGTVTSAARYEPERDHYRNVRDVDWDWSGKERPREKSLALKTLTRVTGYSQLVAQLAAVTRIDGEIESTPSPTEDWAAEPYSVDDAMKDLFMKESSFREMLELLRTKKNLVLQGPPGTGKTLVAERIAWALLGEVDDSRVMRVQFHQSMSYEDFVQAFRPVPDGKGGSAFALQNGAFMRLCDRALQSPDDDFVLIVDEINRGNLSRIFGELLMLLEADKRSPKWGLTLTYSGEADAPFHVPPNVYLIGTMNTADRSLAVVDYALRRRFAFVNIDPGFARNEFLTFLGNRVGAASAKRWAAAFQALNQQIVNDPALGQGFQVGHSYLCGAPSGDDNDGWLAKVVRYEIGPLLQEYWFDSPATATEATERLLAEES